MAGATGGRRSRHGIDRAVLAAGVGNAGAVLEAGAPAAGGGPPDVWHTTPVPSQEQSRTACQQSGLSEALTGHKKRWPLPLKTVQVLRFCFLAYRKQKGCGARPFNPYGLSASVYYKVSIGSLHETARPTGMRRRRDCATGAVRYSEDHVQRNQARKRTPRPHL